MAEGSQAMKDHRPSAKRSRLKREHYINVGLLKDRVDHYVFTKDYEFSSPSAAGTAVRGGATNGLIAWRNKSDVRLKMLDEGVSKLVNSGGKYN